MRSAALGHRLLLTQIQAEISISNFDEIAVNFSNVIISDNYNSYIEKDKNSDVISRKKKYQILHKKRRMNKSGKPAESKVRYG